MDRAFRRAVTVDRLPSRTPCAPLSTNPARLLGLDDRVGSLEPGKDADLVVLDEAFDLVGVMRQGDWLVEPAAAPSPSRSLTAAPPAAAHGAGHGSD